jgi:glycosyltransferase involved in cell wall biosynthesis
VTLAESVVKDLVGSGHEVVVATTDVLDEERRMPPAPGAAETLDGAEIVRFPNVSHRLAAELNSYAPRGLRSWLAAHINRFEVVLLHDFYSAVSVMSARAAARAGVPYVLQPLGTLSPARERGRPLVKRTFMTLWGRETVRGAAAFFYLGEHEAADFVAAGGPRDRLVAMPPPLELPGPLDTSLPDRPTIGFVGRLHPIKGIDRLIEAVAIARRQIPDIQLEIAGPGDRYRRVLEALVRRLGVADAVDFKGFVNGTEKLRILGSTHVSALLSHSEGLPMAALEAMACGTPVVLSRGCYLEEVHGVGGLVVGDTAAEAADGLVALLSDDEMRQRLGAGAMQFAQRYRREHVMPEMIRALEGISAAGSASPTG